jgi:putative phosphonate metabolism protein
MKQWCRVKDDDPGLWISPAEPPHFLTEKERHGTSPVAIFSGTPSMPDEIHGATSGGSGRYALYWAPQEGSDLARLGSTWLGLGEGSDAAGSPPPIPGFDASRIHLLTAEPRRYGLHATLKPPFALAAGTDLASLRLALSEFAALQASVALPALEVTLLDRFIALTPSAASPGLDALAADCVTRFDRFRAPPAAAELARRRSAGLSPAEEAHLLRWGYPYVLDRFRFHVTLTGPLDPAEAQRLMPPLSRMFQPVTRAPVVVADIALFHEPARCAQFRLLERFPLRP